MSAPTIELASDPAEQITFDITAIQERLDTGLYLLGDMPAAIRLRTIMKTSVDLDPEPFAIDPEQAASSAETSINEAIEETAREQQREFIRTVHQDYPKEFDHSNAITSPRQFGKIHDIDDQRANLKRAYSDEVTGAKTALVHTIQQVRPLETVDTDVTSEEMHACASDLARDLHTQIDEKVAELGPLLPQISEKTTLSAKMAKLIFGEQNVIIVEDADIEPRELATKLNELSDLLKTAIAWPTTLSKAIYDIFGSHAKTMAEKQLQEHYETLTSESVKSLATNTDAAYEAILQHQPAHKRDDEDTTPKASSLGESRHSKEIPTETETAEVQTPTGIEEVSLGTLESPFPWLKDADVDVSLLRENGQTLLFSRALWPDAQVLSDHLKTTTDVGRKFPAFEERIKKIELSGTAITHSGIRRVYDADFHDITVCYMRDTRINAGRTYYARTNAGHFPEVAAIAEKQGIDPNTPFVILLAETDKAHQLRVFKELGFKRSEARKGGVGST